MPPDKPTDVKARTWVIVVITVAVLALVGAIFNGAWIKLLEDDETSESSETGPGNQEEIYALQTQVGSLQEQVTDPQEQKIETEEQTPTIITNPEPSPTSQTHTIDTSPQAGVSDPIPTLEPNNPYAGWVICWHGRDGHEYLIAYPEQELIQGLSLNFPLTNAQGDQIDLANDSLKMCYVNDEWYGHPDPNPWFPTVSYAKLSDRRILICSETPGCMGNQWEMVPENKFHSNAPSLQVPTGTGVHVISYFASP